VILGFVDDFLQKVRCEYYSLDSEVGSLGHFYDCWEDGANLRQ
jgi:hypothetical protein